MSICARTPDMHRVVARNAEVEHVIGGFKFAEGPVWDRTKQELVFSDIPASIIYSWSPMHGLREVRNPSNKANGLTFDHEGRLVCCEHATFRLTRIEHDGSITTIASHYGECELNSPNDLVVKSDGSIYFTDPATRRPYWGTDKPRDLPFEGVFRIAAGDQDPSLLIDDFAHPNGLAFSPQERILYVDDTERMHIRAFDVREDGTLENGRVFFVEEGNGKLEDGVPDGLKTDELGNVYCTGPRGIWVINAGGEHLGIIETPERAANLNWGGADGRMLYIAASSSIYRVPLKVCGAT